MSQILWGPKVQDPLKSPEKEEFIYQSYGCDISNLQNLPDSSNSSNFNFETLILILKILILKHCKAHSRVIYIKPVVIRDTNNLREIIFMTTKLSKNQAIARLLCSTSTKNILYHTSWKTNEYSSIKRCPQKKKKILRPSLLKCCGICSLPTVNLAGKNLAQSCQS